MILHNHSLDQDKSFQKLLKFRTLLYLPCLFALAASPWTSVSLS